MTAIVKMFNIALALIINSCVNVIFYRKRAILPKYDLSGFDIIANLLLLVVIPGNVVQVSLFFLMGDGILKTLWDGHGEKQLYFGIPRMIKSLR